MNWERRLLNFLSGLLYVLIAVGVLAYFITYIKSLVTHESVASPLNLAGIAATIGGLILVGAFYKEKGGTNEELALGGELRRIAKFFLGAAVSLTIAFLLFEAVRLMNSPSLTWSDWLLIYVDAIAIAVAGGTLSFALARLARVIPRL